MQILKLVGLWLFFFWIAHQPRGHILVNILFGGRYSSYSWRYRYEPPPLWIQRSVNAIEVMTFILAGILAFACVSSEPISTTDLFPTAVPRHATALQ
jgi:hypothetical protein